MTKIYILAHTTNRILRRNSTFDNCCLLFRSSFCCVKPDLVFLWNALGNIFFAEVAIRFQMKSNPGFSTILPVTFKNSTFLVIAFLVVRTTRHFTVIFQIYLTPENGT
uniref:Uncharacterized protein n=1 Tax=Anguilla anguilla TaxID=7936 RepID=A0A0E9XNU5_ANGAN